MKMVLSSRGLFIIGIVLLLATNLVVLLGVASNRSGDPETLIALTERELQLPYWIHEENSGLSLRLVWRTIGENKDNTDYCGNWISPTWFNAQKLRELGFTIEDTSSSDETSKRHKEQVPKEVFIVLEYNGEAYKEALRRAERALEKAKGALKATNEDKELRESFNKAKEQLERERISESRLFAIDAGLDARKLRAQYSDRARFIITPGIVEPTYFCKDEKKEQFGYISKLSVENINVPLKLRNVFASILAHDKSPECKLSPPRYTVELAYGSRFEPWIRSVHYVTR